MIFLHANLMKPRKEKIFYIEKNRSIGESKNLSKQLSKKQNLE